MNLIGAYRKYMENKDYEAEKFLVYELYKQTQFWIQNGYPDNGFLMEFIEIAIEHEVETPYNPNLLELGLNELIEALNYYNGLEKNIEFINIHLRQALMAFLAWIEPDSFRKIKNFQFSEIDFKIFEIIGGEFPHDAAQFFLKSTDNIDVWTVIKYLEDLNNKEITLEIIEALLLNLKILPEKYILLAYFLYKFPELNHAFFYEKNFNDFIKLPKEIQYSELKSAYLAAEEFLFTGNLKVDFINKILDTKHETIVLFVLLSLFEITNVEITSAWIEVFERAMTNLWSYKFRSLKNPKKHQPLPEFVANIIAFLDEEEQIRIFEISKILIIFFDNIYKYSKQTFEELLDLLTIYPEYFEEELIFRLQKDTIKSKIHFRRLENCANSINKKIVKEGSKYILKELDEI